MMNPIRKSVMGIVVLTLVTAFVGMPGGWAAEPGMEAKVEGYDKIVTRSVEIWSDGTRLAGDLFYPKDRVGGEKLPAIVLCHGWGGK